MTYEQLWHRLSAIYEPGEAKAITRLVLKERFGLTMADILCGKVTQLSADSQLTLENMFCRLEKAEPVQYVLGRACFCGRYFKVAPGVLIPRPETEELCQWVIDEQTDSRRLLDIGTGSGCIAISLALELPSTRLTAWDISTTALQIARENATALGAMVRCEQRDILQACANGDEHWDAIVSNPPYVCQREAAYMQRNVLDHEPGLALFVPDENPLLFYRAIASYALQTLAPGGCLYFELNPHFSDQVGQLLTDLGLTDIIFRSDQFHKKRFVRGMKGMRDEENEHNKHKDEERNK
mgnify:CR=1 FL=1